MPAPRFRHTFESAALALSLLACSAPTPTEAPSTPVPAATAAPLTATTQSTPLALPTPTPRAALGVYTASVDAAWRRLLRLDVERGAVIVVVVSGSPAARAGVLKGDVVLALDDQPVRNAPELQRRLPRSVGQMVRLSVSRGGGRLTLTATTASSEAVDAQSAETLEAARAEAQASPQDPFALYRLAILLPPRETRAAIEYLDGAIDLAPDFAAAHLERAGRWTDLYLAEPRPGQQPATSPYFFPALDDYTRAAELAPDLWDAFHDRSNFYYLTRQYASAASDGQRATELDPEEPRGWVRLGWGTYGLRQFGVAEEAFLRALPLDPEQEEAHFGLARVYRDRTPRDDARGLAAYLNVLRYSWDEARRSEAANWVEILSR